MSLNERGGEGGSQLTDVLEVVAAGGGVPAVAAAPPLRRNCPGQAVLFRRVEGLLRPAELGDGAPGAGPLPHALLLDVVAREPEFGAATPRAGDCTKARKH